LDENWVKSREIRLAAGLTGSGAGFSGWRPVSLRCEYVVPVCRPVGARFGSGRPGLELGAARRLLWWLSGARGGGLAWRAMGGRLGRAFAGWRWAWGGAAWGGPSRAAGAWPGRLRAQSMRGEVLGRAQRGDLVVEAAWHVGLGRARAGRGGGQGRWRVELGQGGELGWARPGVRDAGRGAGVDQGAGGLSRCLGGAWWRADRAGRQAATKNSSCS
jgi:hypothetical protein